MKLTKLEQAMLDGAHGRAAQCWQPYVKGFVRQENSIYNHWRLEQVWIEK